jgi:hypothetical protein
MAREHLPGKDAGMTDRIKEIDMGDEFKICPTCGYKDGFHSMFKKQGKSTKWLFICPTCHGIFDIGLTAADATAH